MKKLQLLLFSLLMVGCLGFTSCEDEDRYMNDIIGSWVSVDDPTDIWYVQFYGDGTGMRIEQNYQGSYREYFTWYADSRYIYAQYQDDGARETWEYGYGQSGYFYIDGVPFQRNNPYYSKHK